jgi:hypothetical protein
MKTKIATSTVLVLMFSLGMVSSALGLGESMANYDADGNFNHSTGALTGVLTGDTDGATHDNAVPATVSGGVLHAGSNHNSGVKYDGSLSDYFNIDGVNWGSNTIFGIVNLNDNSGGTRHFATVGYDSTGSNSNVNGMRFEAEVDGPTAARIAIFSGYAKAELGMGIGSTQAGKDHFVAGSWRDNLDGTVQMSLYMQTLDGSQLGVNLGATEDRFFTTIARNDPGDVTDFGAGSQYLYVGRDSRRFTTAPAIGACNCDIDLFAISHSYIADQAGYEALFASIPEPMTLSLVAVGGLLSVLRRRS